LAGAFFEAVLASLTLTPPFLDLGAMEEARFFPAVAFWLFAV